MAEDVNQAGLGDLVRKHGWVKVGSYGLALAGFGILTAMAIASYDNGLQARFGKGSWAAAMGLPAAAVLLRLGAEMLKKRQPPV